MFTTEGTVNQGGTTDCPYVYDFGNGLRIHIGEDGSVYIYDDRSPYAQPDGEIIMWEPTEYEDESALVAAMNFMLLAATDPTEFRARMNMIHRTVNHAKD